MKAVRVQMEDLPQPDRSALDYCRKLISEGVNPKTPLRVYRGDMLALKVRSIGEGAELIADGTRFRKYRPSDANKQAY